MMCSLVGNHLAEGWVCLSCRDVFLNVGMSSINRSIVNFWSCSLEIRSAILCVYCHWLILSCHVCSWVPEQRIIALDLIWCQSLDEQTYLPNIVLGCARYNCVNIAMGSRAGAFNLAGGNGMWLLKLSRGKSEISFVYSAPIIGPPCWGWLTLPRRWGIARCVGTLTSCESHSSTWL